MLSSANPKSFRKTIYIKYVQGRQLIAHWQLSRLKQATESESHHLLCTTANRYTDQNLGQMHRGHKTKHAHTRNTYIFNGKYTPSYQPGKHSKINNKK